MKTAHRPSVMHVQRPKARRRQVRLRSLRALAMSVALVVLFACASTGIQQGAPVNCPACGYEFEAHPQQ